MLSTLKIKLTSNDCVLGIVLPTPPLHSVTTNQS